MLDGLHLGTCLGFRFCHGDHTKPSRARALLVDAPASGAIISSEAKSRKKKKTEGEGSGRVTGVNLSMLILS